MSAFVIRGRNVFASGASTSNVSTALQTPGRWHLALMTIFSAMSRSASRSTNTWQTPL
jgi:hypothetical protein